MGSLQIFNRILFDKSNTGEGFYAQVDQPDSNAMHYAKHTITINLSTEDAQNGIDAFLNKKTPVWKNR